MLAFVKQEFDAGRVMPADLVQLIIRLDRERAEAATTVNVRFGAVQHDEARVAALCERFWSELPHA